MICDEGSVTPVSSYERPCITLKVSPWNANKLPILFTK